MAQLDEMLPIFNPCQYPAETVLFLQGDPAEFLFLVVTGEVVVTFKPDDAPPIVVARVQPGGVVGWSAVVGSRMYTSGAACSTDTNMMAVRGSDLRRLCEAHPVTGAMVLDRLATVIAQRLSNTHDQVVSLLMSGLSNGSTCIYPLVGGNGNNHGG